MDNKQFGLLINEDTLLHRNYFIEMTKLLGIQVLYYEPKENSHFDVYGDLKANYKDPQLVGCIFDEHPTIWTMKKLGWNHEQQENTSIINVPFDLPNLQVGALFAVPDSLSKKARMFRVIRMSSTMLYPASIACELAPEWETNSHSSQLHDFKQTNFNLLNEEENG